MACSLSGLNGRYTRLLYNELFERIVDTCVEYVLDSTSRGRDWPAELAALDVTLRSQVSEAIRPVFEMFAQQSPVLPCPILYVIARKSAISTRSAVSHAASFNFAGLAEKKTLNVRACQFFAREAGHHPITSPNLQYLFARPALYFFRGVHVHSAGPSNHT